MRRGGVASLACFARGSGEGFPRGSVGWASFCAVGSTPGDKTLRCDRPVGRPLKLCLAGKLSLDMVFKERANLNSYIVGEFRGKAANEQALATLLGVIVRACAVLRPLAQHCDLGGRYRTLCTESA